MYAKADLIADLDIIVERDIPQATSVYVSYDTDGRPTGYCIQAAILLIRDLDPRFHAFHQIVELGFWALDGDAKPEPIDPEQIVADNNNGVSFREIRERLLNRVYDVHTAENGYQT